MILKRNVGLSGLKYRGGGPMLAWSLHRISGIILISLLSMHVLSSFFQHQLGNDLATNINIIYESIYIQLFIVFAVLFHGLNGFRIIILDIFPKLIEYQREVTWLQWLAFIPIYGLTVFIMITRTFGGN